MSWSDVIIGKGLTGCSAIKVFDLPDCNHHHVSHNGISYWVSNCIMDFGITIFKDTPEGQKFTRMIKEKKPLGDIHEWLDGLIIRRVSPKQLHARIKQNLERSFLEGKRAAKDELLCWLHG